MRIAILGLVCGMLLAMVTAGRAATIFSGIGLGDEEWVPDGRGAGMGGAGSVLLDGQNFGRLNPAALASFRRSGLSVLFRTEERSARDAYSTNRLSEGQLSHVRLMIPRGKRLVFRVGIEPVTASRFGFRTPQPAEVEPDTLHMEIRGGLQAVSAAVGIKLNKGKVMLGIGLDAVLMGEIQETWTRSFANQDIYPSTDEISRRHRGLRWTLGSAFLLGKGYSAGAYLIPQSSLTQTRTLKTIYAFQEKSSVRMRLPTTFAAGVAYESPDHRWVAALDVTASRWSRVDAQRYRDSYGIAAGVGYLTGRDDPLTRSRRIPLRMGGSRRVLHYAGLPGTGGAVTETSGSLGMGLPFRGGWGRFDLSFEMGKRGDIRKNGARELVFRQTFSIMGWAR